MKDDGQKKRRRKDRLLKAKVERKRRMSNKQIKIRKTTDKYKIRGSLNKFPDFFRMGTFIDCTHMKL